MPGRTKKAEDANMEDAPPSAQPDANQDAEMDEMEEEEEEEEEEQEPQRVKIVRGKTIT
jgi:DNA-directed RNA polymerase I and III subunit RPAC2